MGEGIDPTQMCQSLVDKVAQSKQLMAITDPGLLVLFEDWFEELEDEIISLNGKYGPLSAEEVAKIWLPTVVLFYLHTPVYLFDPLMLIVPFFFFRVF